MVEPFLKWPGGKRWLVSRQALFPKNVRSYVEPFLGGGAVFFHLAPDRALLADTNAELVNAYQCVASRALSIERRLCALEREHSSASYYRMRAARPRTDLGRAVRFIYLNRTCFNGIYRVNRDGDFNVPMGSKTAVAFTGGYLAKVSGALSRASVVVADFEETIEASKRGDFLYVDPPYTVMHNTNNFVKYNASLFSWADQLRLATAVERAVRRGARVMLSNADHQSVHQLYADFGYRYRIARRSVLSASSAYRRDTSEMLLTTYRLPRSAAEEV